MAIQQRHSGLWAHAGIQRKFDHSEVACTRIAKPFPHRTIANVKSKAKNSNCLLVVQRAIRVHHRSARADTTSRAIRASASVTAIKVIGRSAHSNQEAARRFPRRDSRKIPQLPVRSLATRHRGPTPSLPDRQVGAAQNCARKAKHELHPSRLPRSSCSLRLRPHV